MYLNVCVCIYMYPVCICTYIHVFGRICMYAISTEKMPSIIVFMTWALGVMYLNVCAHASSPVYPGRIGQRVHYPAQCKSFSSQSRYGSFSRRYHGHQRVALLVWYIQIRTYTYVYMLILAYTYSYMHIRTLYVTPKSVVCNAQVRNFSHIHVRKPQVSRM